MGLGCQIDIMSNKQIYRCTKHRHTLETALATVETAFQAAHRQRNLAKKCSFVFIFLTEQTIGWCLKDSVAVSLWERHDMDLMAGFFLDSGKVFF